MKIYNTARSAPTPALSALATLFLAASLIVVALGFFGSRAQRRGEGAGGFGSFADQL